jgi:hypothetical protein
MTTHTLLAGWLALAPLARAYLATTTMITVGPR